MENECRGYHFTPVRSALIALCLLLILLAISRDQGTEGWVTIPSNGGSVRLDTNLEGKVLRIQLGQEFTFSSNRFELSIIGPYGLCRTTLPGKPISYPVLPGKHTYRVTGVPLEENSLKPGWERTIFVQSSQ